MAGFPLGGGILIGEKVSHYPSRDALKVPYGSPSGSITQTPQSIRLVLLSRTRAAWGARGRKPGIAYGSTAG